MVIHSHLKKIQGASERMGSMYLCLPTSICKGVSERPRIRRAEILLVNESNSAMTEYARATFSTVAPTMSFLEQNIWNEEKISRLLFISKNGSWRMLESP
uniref:LUC7-like 2 (S. cerevisiae) n=1 Tax=Mus musculus TaxID=10090 RepID=E0CZB9_MOUSE